MRIFGSMLAILTVVACVPTKSFDELTGDGPLHMTRGNWAHFQKYRAELNPGAFAINPQRGIAYFNYCPAQQCEGGDWMRDAIRACGERTNGECKLFANFGELVWNGPIYVDGRRINGPDDTFERDDGGKRVDAVYRMIDGDEIGAWVQGTLVVIPKRGRQRISGSFRDGVVCDGHVDTPKDGEGFVTEGTVNVRCARTTGDAISTEVNGAFVSTAPYVGRFEGSDGGSIRIEVGYSPKRR